MKRYSQRSGHTAMAELNVTPLLDLAFVLLIIFIITTPLLENSIPLSLPAAADNHNQPPDAKSIRTVSIDKSGQVFLESKPIELPVLEQELTAFRQNTPDAGVVIRADKSLRYQQVVDVMDILQRAQISRWRFDTVVP
jgi:biopolymer transport protein ExbD